MDLPHVGAAGAAPLLFTMDCLNGYFNIPA